MTQIFLRKCLKEVAAYCSLIIKRHISMQMNLKEFTDKIAI